MVKLILSAFLAAGWGQSFGAPEDVGIDVSATDVQSRIPQPIGQDQGSFALPLFTEGLWTRYSANVVPGNSLTMANNVLIDEDVDGVIVRRNGYAKCNSTALTDEKAIRGLWEFPASDGTKYQIAVSSESFFEHTGDCSFTEVSPVLNNFDSAAEFDCVVGLGKLWCVDGTNLVWYDGTSTAAVSGAPAASFVDIFRNRIVLGGITGAQSQIKLSGELDGEDWTIPSDNILSTHPATISIGGVNDGEDISCLMGTYGDKFLVGKEGALYALYGFDRRDFVLREISREVGCLENKSVQEKNNRLYWMSLRGIERLSGNVIERVSDPIRDQVDVLIDAAGNSRSLLDTTQSDFESGDLQYAGPGAPMSSTISPGSVVPTTFSVTIDTDGEWDDGTFDDNTVYNSDTVQNSSHPHIIYNGDAETGDETGWTCENVGYPNDLCEANTSGKITGTYGFQVFSQSCPGQAGGYSCRYDVYDEEDNLLIDNRSCGASPDTIDLSDYLDKAVKIKFKAYGGTCAVDQNKVGLFSSTFTHLGSLTYSYSTIDTSTKLGIDTLDLINTTSYMTSSTQTTITGEYTSPIFDTGFSTPIGGTFNISSTVPDGTTLDFAVRSASSTSGVWTVYSDINEFDKISQVKQYWQYISSFTTIHGSATAVLSSLTLEAGTTGQFVSQGLNAGSAITEWGRLECNGLPRDGTLSYFVSTGTTQADAENGPWTAQTNNSVITEGIGAWISYRVDLEGFDLFSATTTPIHQDCTVNWNDGANRPAVDSAVYKDRYYLAYTSSTGSGAANDHILVLDRNDKWTLFTNHNCHSLNVYQRDLYCGSSSNNGFVYTMDVGTDDDGSGFKTVVKTPAYNMGYPQYRKAFETLYLDLEPEVNDTDEITITARYVLDRGTFTHSMGTVDLGEDPDRLLTADIPFPLTEPTDGRYVQIELETDGTNQPWRLFGGRLYWRPIRRE